MTVTGRLDGHFVARRNIVFERATFNQRQQELGESADSFHTALHCLAEHCGYGALHDEMVRGRIVVGLKDKRLSEQLQMDPELTLERAINKARQSELVKRQQEMLKVNFRTDIASTQLDSVHARQQFGARPKHVKQHKEKRAPQDKQTQCRRCGDARGHSLQQCPAKDAMCNLCRKQGHYPRVCRNKKRQQ